MTKNQARYIGFLNTPTLWNNNDIYNFEQFEIAFNETPFLEKIKTRLRLGKLVERFVSHQLALDNSISIIDENLVIDNNKITVGELDCLLTKNSQPHHLEIVYKFYLQDASVGHSPLHHWIGPNRKDSLIEKLDKLKYKQFPLLYNSHTQSALKHFQLNPKNIKQVVLFKAQLFVPYNQKTPIYPSINSDCIVGYYYTFNQIKTLSNAKFYIPEKLDWLIKIPTQINWKTFNLFITELQPLLDNKQSPLIWIKQPNGETQKAFVVWWS